MDGTITISKETFKEACIDVLKDTIHNDDLKGSAAFIIPMIKMSFAQELESKLFGEKEEEKNE